MIMHKVSLGDRIKWIHSPLTYCRTSSSLNHFMQPKSKVRIHNRRHISSFESTESTYERTTRCNASGQIGNLLSIDATNNGRLSSWCWCVRLEEWMVQLIMRASEMDWPSENWPDFWIDFDEWNALGVQLSERSCLVFGIFQLSYICFECPIVRTQFGFRSSPSVPNAQTNL